MCVCLTLDLTVISLISAGLRLNYFGLPSVHLRAELGLMKVWILFLSSWGILRQWLCRSRPHAVTCLHNKPPLYHLALDISDTFSYEKAFSHPVFPPQEIQFPCSHSTHTGCCGPAPHQGIVFLPSCGLSSLSFWWRQQEENPGFVCRLIQ